MGEGEEGEGEGKGEERRRRKDKGEDHLVAGGGGRVKAADRFRQFDPRTTLGLKVEVEIMLS